MTSSHGQASRNPSKRLPPLVQEPIPTVRLEGSFPIVQPASPSRQLHAGAQGELAKPPLSPASPAAALPACAPGSVSPRICLFVRSPDDAPGVH